MAKQIVVSHQGKTSSFDFQKLDRKKLYAHRKRIVLDSDGEVCQRAELTQDGATILRPGMTAQGYFTEEGRWLAAKDLIGLDGGGNPVEKRPSTLGQAQLLHGPVTPDEVLDLAVQTVYSLNPAELEPDLKSEVEAGAIFRFAFNYRADYHEETAFLLANEAGWFALVGHLHRPLWCELEKPALETFVDGDDDSDLDFDMF